MFMLQRYPWSILVGSGDGYLRREEKYLAVIVVLIRNAPQQLPLPHLLLPVQLGGCKYLNAVSLPQRGDSPSRGELSCFWDVPCGAACPFPLLLPLCWSKAFSGEEEFAPALDFVLQKYQIPNCVTQRQQQKPSLDSSFFYWEITQ